MSFGVRNVEIALIFSKGFHHRLWLSDFGRGLFGEGETELFEQEMMDFLGLGVAFHPDFTTVHPK